MDGTLSYRLADQFLSGDRQRGRDYFTADKVAIDSVDEVDVTASVRSGFGDPYEVQLNLAEVGEGTVTARCECRRFLDGYNCKHIWATILELEASVESADSDIDEDDEASVEIEDVTPEWKQQIAVLKQYIHGDAPVSINNAVETLEEQATQYWFVVSLDEPAPTPNLRLRIFESVENKSGGWSKPQRKSISQHEVDSLPESSEREILNLLQPVGDSGFGKGYYQQYNKCDLFSFPPYSQDRVLALLEETGRFVWTRADNQVLGETTPLSWDAEGTWQLQFLVDQGADKHLTVTAHLQRGDEALSLENVILAFADGWVLLDERLGKLRTSDAEWVSAWKASGPMQVDSAELGTFLGDFLDMPNVPTVRFADNVDVQLQTGAPEGKLVFSTPSYENSTQLQVKVVFKYGEFETRPDEPRNMVWDAETRTVIERDMAAEAKLMQQLKRFKFQTPRAYLKGLVDLRLHEKWLAEVVTELGAAGWDIVAHGHAMRQATAFKIQVKSGSDWFDLNAEVEFEGATASFPELLAAIKKKQDYIVLDDGTRGIVPQEWVKRYTKFAHVGVTNDGAVRFSKSQALLLDALLAEQEHVTVDRSFRDYCERVHRFSGIDPQQEPRTFQGELREYQRDGLGWLSFLRDFDFGGCLADDMGLGKTIQVLAMLESQRTRALEAGKQRLPSIVIVPKSLVFNWKDEAERFTPELKVIDYTGTEREELLSTMSEVDLVVTTYGTLRRDIAKLKKVSFDYAILDESQAIKNASSQAAKAARLLQARFRLAMTGTPVENHLGELWSLFDFLNPGMLGKAAGFRKLTKTEDTEALGWLNKTLRPFFLRRTKSQVLTELPEKSEQTLYCEMDEPQQQLYNELRDHYRMSIGHKVKQVGLGQTKIHVLEALLRLRQAACDPRLLRPDSGIVGAKLELLVEKLTEIMEEGHKALVFSQFTSLLSLVRKQMDAKGWTYEYLDGKTRNREARVKRFQSDEDCKLFLISLKAGGHGLNLTAADYVFILDPWWNPAVEAQAIDRAHRIGQTRRVMAYRIICRDTVEDKIVKLQQSKRDLADAIISANESLISRLTPDDLQALFT